MKKASFKESFWLRVAISFAKESLSHPRVKVEDLHLHIHTYIYLKKIKTKHMKNVIYFVKNNTRIYTYRLDYLVI